MHAEPVQLAISQGVQAGLDLRARSPGTPTYLVWLQRRPNRFERLHALASLDSSLDLATQLAVLVIGRDAHHTSSQRASSLLDAIAETQP